MAYSEDLKQKAVNCIGRGKSQREVAKLFGLSLDTVNKWWQKYRDTGDLKNKPPQPRPFKKIDPEKLRAHITEHPDAYLAEIAEVFNCSDTAVGKALNRLGITRKKRRGATGSKTPNR